MIESKSIANRLFNVGNYIILALFAILCVFPMINVVAISFSDRSAAVGGFVLLWPIRFTLASYELVAKTSLVFSSFVVSVQRTVIGTALGMAVTILTSYPLSKTESEFRGRRYLTWLLLFAMLFSGGLIPWWLVIRQIGLLNKIWALIIPGALSIWNVILLTNFFREIPQDLDDAASVDGATHWYKLLRVYIPLSTPALATLTLFTTVGHWNSWFDGMILINNINLQPLQTIMRQIVINLDLSQMTKDPASLALYSDRSMRAATIVVATLPILVVYPFIQRYFVAGIRLGAVKG